MCFIRGFDEQILESLNSKNPDILYQAVCAAGNWEVGAAWPHVAAIVTSEETEKDLLLAAIEAVVGINLQKAPEILFDLTESEDEDIAEAADEAMVMAEGLSELEELDDEGFLH
jgi:HEAT repeat protein